MYSVPVDVYFLILALVAPASAFLIQSIPEEKKESAKNNLELLFYFKLYVLRF
jgi:hypothetical protein